jgi:RecJ-like exonuclease
MKKTTSIVLLAAVLSLTACAKKATDASQGTETDSIAATPADKTEVVTDSLNADTAETETEAPVIVTVKGTVTSINQGKDGVTAELKDDAGKVYFATISIPNLDDPKQYRAVKKGDVITVKGDSWKMDDELHIKVTELK